MKSSLKYIFLFGLIIFSFYYTDKVSTMMINNSLLMQTIKDNASFYEIPSTNAIIINNKIIPGQNGREVNLYHSYYQMKNDNYFDASKLVFNETIPSLSLENNKEYIIDKVRYQKRGLSLVFKDNQEILNYLNNKHLIINRLVNKITFNKNASYEQISIDEQTDHLLTKYQLNKQLCFNNYFDLDYCLITGKYIVHSTYDINNLLNIDQKIISGNILFLEDTLSLSDFKLLLSKIYSKDLKLYYLNDFISEKA